MCGGRLKLPTKLDPLALGLQRLGDLEGHGAAVGVAGDGVGAVRLAGADGLHIALHHLLEAGEGLLVLVEATGAQRVERPVADEVLGEVDEDQHLADAGVDTEQRGLLAAGLQRYDRVVRRGAGRAAVAEPGGELPYRGRREHRDDRQVRHAQAPVDLAPQPQDVQRGAAQVEEAGGADALHDAAPARSSEDV
ncbi:hypothetical protein SANTM175S_03021 [Streptomyces antimycoticus]